MKRYMDLFAALVLALCLVGPGRLQLARAQGEPGAEAEQELQKLRKVLNLTPTQESKLEPILQDQIQKIEAIKKNASLSGQEKVKQVQAVRAQADPQVKAILNPTQYKQWESIRKNEIDEIKEQNR